MREFPFFIVLSVDQLALCCPKSPKMHLFFTNKQKKFAFVVTDSASRGSYVIYEHSKAENMSGVGNFGCGKYQNDTKSDFVIFLTKNPSFYPPQ